MALLSFKTAFLSSSQVDDLDALLATRKEFLLGVWLVDARSNGATKDEQDRGDRDTRDLLTTSLK